MHNQKQQQRKKERNKDFTITIAQTYFEKKKKFFERFQLIDWSHKPQKKEE